MRRNKPQLRFVYLVLSVLGVVLLFTVFFLRPKGGSSTETVVMENEPSIAVAKRPIVRKKVSVPAEKVPEERVVQPVRPPEDSLLKAEKRNEQQEIADRKFYNTPAGRIHRQHPEWSRKDCEKLAQDTIWIGMSYAMLKYLKGQPNHNSRVREGKRMVSEWCWDGMTPYCYYDKNGDGRVDSYQ